MTEIVYAAAKPAVHLLTVHQHFYKGFAVRFPPNAASGTHKHNVAVKDWHFAGTRVFKHFPNSLPDLVSRSRSLVAADHKLPALQPQTFVPIVNNQAYWRCGAVKGAVGSPDDFASAKIIEIVLHCNVAARSIFEIGGKTRFVVTPHLFAVSFHSFGFAALILGAGTKPKAPPERTLVQNPKSGASGPLTIAITAPRTTIIKSATQCIEKLKQLLLQINRWNTFALVVVMSPSKFTTACEGVARWVGNVLGGALLDCTPIGVVLLSEEVSICVDVRPLGVLQQFEVQNDGVCGKC